MKNGPAWARGENVRQYGKEAMGHGMGHRWARRGQKGPAVRAPVGGRDLGCEGAEAGGARPRERPRSPTPASPPSPRLACTGKGA